MEQNKSDRYIIEESPVIMRKIAASSLRGYWLKVSVGILIYFIFTTFIITVVSKYLPFGSYNIELPKNDVYPDGLKYRMSYFSNLYGIFIVGALDIGLFKFMLKFFEEKKIRPDYIFDGFGYYLRTLALNVIMLIRTMIWLFMLVVPGVIVAISMSQAKIIMAEDPSKSPMQCIKESTVRMRGNMMKYFIYNIPLYFLIITAEIPKYYLLVSIANKNISGAIAVIFFVIATIPQILAIEYTKMCQTVFYELLTGRLRKTD